MVVTVYDRSLTVLGLPGSALLRLAWDAGPTAAEGELISLLLDGAFPVRRRGDHLALPDDGAGQRGALPRPRGRTSRSGQACSKPWSMEGRTA